MLKLYVLNNQDKYFEFIITCKNDVHTHYGRARILFYHTTYVEEIQLTRAICDN